MDNQQETFELGWLVAIIDGEGSIGLNVRKSSRGYAVIPRVIISNTDKAIIDRAIAALKRFRIPHWVDKARPNPQARLCWRIVIEGLKRNRVLLSKLGDLLTGAKHEKAALLREFVESRLAKWHRAPFDAKEIEIARRLAYLNGSTNSERLLRDYTRSARFQRDDIVQTTTPAQAA